MREIKFQVMWIKNNSDFTKSIETHHTTIDRLISGKDRFPYSDVDVIAKRQFTGMNDEFGVEIYEGDEVSFVNDHDNSENGIVEFTSCGRWIVKTKESYKMLYDVCAVVIGNIHENSELLK